MSYFKIYFDLSFFDHFLLKKLLNHKKSERKKKALKTIKQRKKYLISHSMHNWKIKLHFKILHVFGHKMKQKLYFFL